MVIGLTDSCKWWVRKIVRTSMVVSTSSVRHGGCVGCQVDGTTSDPSLS